MGLITSFVLARNIRDAPPTTTASPILLNAYHRVMYHVYVLYHSNRTRDWMGGSNRASYDTVPYETLQSSTILLYEAVRIGGTIITRQMHKKWEQSG